MNRIHFPLVIKRDTISFQMITNLTVYWHCQWTLNPKISFTCICSNFQNEFDSKSPIFVLTWQQTDVKWRINMTWNCNAAFEILENPDFDCRYWFLSDIFPLEIKKRVHHPTFYWENPDILILKGYGGETNNCNLRRGMRFGGFMFNKKKHFYSLTDMYPWILNLCL